MFDMTSKVMISFKVIKEYLPDSVTLKSGANLYVFSNRSLLRKKFCEPPVET